MKISRQDAKVAKLFFASFFLCGFVALREIKDFQGSAQAFVDFLYYRPKDDG